MDDVLIWKLVFKETFLMSFEAFWTVLPIDHDCSFN